MKRTLGFLFWTAIAIAAALCLGLIATQRGELVNSIRLAPGVRIDN